MNAQEINAICDRAQAARSLEAAIDLMLPIVATKEEEVDPVTWDRLQRLLWVDVSAKPRQAWLDAEERMLAEATSVSPSDPDDPNRFYRAFLGAANAAPGSEEQVLHQFREGVIAYIQWVSDNEYELADVAAVERAATFEEIQRVLARYDNPECSFLSMVKQGYFV
jgi:hypothetical protein